MDFDGPSAGDPDRMLTAINQESYITISSGIITAFEVGILAKADTSAAKQTDVYNDRPLLYFGGDGQPTAIVHTNSGVSLGGYTGVGGWRRTGDIACGTGSYFGVFAWCDNGGADVHIQLNGDTGSAQSLTGLTGGGFAPGTNTAVRIGGPNFGSKFFDGEIVEIMIATSGQIQPNIAKILRAWNHDYGLSLS